MDYTPQQIEEFKSQFSSRRRRQLLVSAPLIIIVLLLAVAQDREAGTLAGLPEQVWLPVFVVLVVSVLIFSLWNWRCPGLFSLLREGLESTVLWAVRNPLARLDRPAECGPTSRCSWRARRDA